MRFPALVFVALVVAVGLDLQAQSTNATLTGEVTDHSKAVIAGVEVLAISSNTGAAYDARSDSSGVYRLSNLPPGRYRLEVEKSGFKKLIKPDVNLHVQDVLSVDFEMQVGPTSETVRVESGASSLNTESATVSTLVDNRFVENLPLNGRSFSSLLDLTPGIVLTSTAAYYEQGQFSVNGQRPNANYFMVDGVSANLGTPGTLFGQGGTGQLPATSASGGMSNLVSVDALQEFRVQTSTFAPEFGRAPGAQISVLTKSGTNSLSGTAFEYLRNDVFDANDWFADNKGLAKPALRQNCSSLDPMKAFESASRKLRTRSSPRLRRARVRQSPYNLCSTPFRFRTARISATERPNLQPATRTHRPWILTVVVSTTLCYLGSVFLQDTATHRPALLSVLV